MDGEGVKLQLLSSPSLIDLSQYKIDILIYFRFNIMHFYLFQGIDQSFSPSIGNIGDGSSQVVGEMSPCITNNAGSHKVDQSLTFG